MPAQVRPPARRIDAAGKPLMRPAKRPISLHDLLTHTAGFAYRLWDREALKYYKAIDKLPAAERRKPAQWAREASGQLIFGARHLRRVLAVYSRYYNEMRTHLSLDKDAPVSRAVQAVGRIFGRPILGGLHHQYVRI
jgi:hypothetical protein